MQTQFDLIANQYDETLPAHVIEHYLRKRTNFIQRLANPCIMLDVGCGTGLLAKNLAERGFSPVGLDLSQKMLEVAKEHDNICLCVCGTSTALPFKSESFHLVTNIAMLHHLGSKQKVGDTISEMVRVTKPGGRIVIWDHNPANPYWPILMKKLPQDCGNERLVPLGEIINVLKKCHVNDIKTYKKSFIPDFAPKFMMPFIVICESFFEKLPRFRRLSAHNVVVASK